MNSVRQLNDMTPAQRRDEIAIILARAIERLHRRSALGELPTIFHDREIGLDSGRELGLSVTERHNG